MLSNETVRKLQEMRLGVMAEAFSAPVLPCWWMQNGAPGKATA